MPSHFEDLLATIRTLRAPGGCPWDQKQTLHNAARYLMDEAAELVEATLAEDVAGSREELADLLFMTCFCTQILGETEQVTMQDIAREGNAKLATPRPAPPVKARNNGTPSNARKSWPRDSTLTRIPP